MVIYVVSRICFSVRLWIRSPFILFVCYILLMAFCSSTVFLSTSTSSLMLLRTVIWLLRILIWLMTVMVFGLFVRTLPISVFVAPFELFRLHLLRILFLIMVSMILCVLDFVYSTKVSPLSFLILIPWG